MSKLFTFTQSIAMDLGTANTVIMQDNQVVVDQPSVVAIRVADDSMLAVGKKANAMIDRPVDRIRAIRPLKDGVISDYKACEKMIRGLIKMMPQKPRLFTPSIKMVVAIPSGSTDAEIRTVRDSCEHAGARELHLIYEPMAAALGMGMDIEGPEGCMVVDIGGGTTEIAVMALGSLVVNQSIPVAGDSFNRDIINHMDKVHNMRISAPTAERIKMNVGSALHELEDAPEDMMVVGPNRTTDLPLHVPVSYQEIAFCLDKNIQQIETAIRQALGQTPSELYADIVERGVYLTGGGALLHGLAKRLSDKFHIQFHVADDPLHSVAKGTCIALENTENFSFLIGNKN